MVNSIPWCSPVQIARMPPSSAILHRSMNSSYSCWCGWLSSVRSIWAKRENSILRSFVMIVDIAAVIVAHIQVEMPCGAFDCIAGQHCGLRGGCDLDLVQIRDGDQGSRSLGWGGSGMRLNKGGPLPSGAVGIDRKYLAQFCLHTQGAKPIQQALACGCIGL